MDEAVSTWLNGTDQDFEERGQSEYVCNNVKERILEGLEFQSITIAKETVLIAMSANNQSGATVAKPETQLDKNKKIFVSLCLRHWMPYVTSVHHQ